jgi:hypothetical protein
MADDRYRQDRPPQNRPEDQPSHLSRHHPPPADEPRASSDSSRASMAASVTLPSIHDPRSGGYGAPPPPSSGGRGYTHDPRYASPNAVNGYPPPQGGQQPPASYLPPMQSQDPRGAPYPPQDPRGPYYDDRRGPPHPDAPYPPDAYFYRGPPGAPPNGYPRPHPGAYGPEYAQPGNAPPQMAQAAPRQRTSIACRYCRKRKVCRCGSLAPVRAGSARGSALALLEAFFFFLLTRLVADMGVDSMQRLSECPRRQVSKLRSNEPRVHLPTRFILQFHCVHSRFRSPRWCSSRYPAFWSLWTALGAQFRAALASLCRCRRPAPAASRRGRGRLLPDNAISHGLIFVIRRLEGG